MPVYFPGQAKNGDVTPNGAAASNGPGELRRSGAGVLNRARARTLKMTVVMVCVFIFCWTPYYVISMWWVAVIDHANLLSYFITSSLLFAAFQVSGGQGLLQQVGLAAATDTVHLRLHQLCCRPLRLRLLQSEVSKYREFTTSESLELVQHVNKSIARRKPKSNMHNRTVVDNGTPTAMTTAGVSANKKLRRNTTFLSEGEDVSVQVKRHGTR